MAALSVVLFALATPMAGRVLQVEIEGRVPILSGKNFGESGAYELLWGRVHFGVDPALPANTRIHDLDLAPRGSDGLVHAESDLLVMQPADPARRRGTALLEVVNRGRRLAVYSFNRGAFAFDRPPVVDPSDPETFGDGFLMEQGLTLISVGWQADLPEIPGMLRLDAPIASGPEGAPLRGLARSDWVVDEATRQLPLASLAHVPYLAADPSASENVLSVRSGREAPRRTVPREQWQFGRFERGRLVEDRSHVAMPSGFEPGHIYEVVYVAERPVVMGLGFAALRDLASHALYDDDCRFSVRRVVTVGSSQSGRFLRHLLYEGLHEDESGRRVFDAVLANIGGAGRGGFNHRFAQPGRAATRYNGFFHPVDLFPFASRPLLDPETGERAGLFDRLGDPATAPLIFQVNTGYEYWGRAASLVHTTPAGDADVEPLPNERIYHLASAPHYSLPFPPNAATEAPEGVYRGSSVDTSSAMRALLLRLLAWVEAGRAPPPSRIPRIADGTLVALRDLKPPRVPGLRWPEVAHVAYRQDFGPRFARGIVDIEPPRLGLAFAVRVPRVDALGNEATGIRTLETRVPVGTYAPWLLRGEGLAAPGEMMDFMGSFAPLATTPEVRAARGDSRPSLLELYASRAVYDARVEQAMARLVEEGFLLSSDRQRERRRAALRWEWMQARARAAR